MLTPTSNVDRPAALPGPSSPPLSLSLCARMRSPLTAPSLEASSPPAPSCAGAAAADRGDGSTSACSGASAVALLPLHCAMIEPITAAASPMRCSNGEGGAPVASLLEMPVGRFTSRSGSAVTWSSGGTADALAADALGGCGPRRIFGKKRHDGCESAAARASICLSSTPSPRGGPEGGCVSDHALDPASDAAELNLWCSRSCSRCWSMAKFSARTCHVRTAASREARTATCIGQQA